MRIRWKTIMKIARSIVKRNIKIHLTTALEDMIAYMQSSKSGIDLLISAPRCKSEEQVVCAISHELAHALLNSTFHDDAWNRSLKIILNTFEKEMNLFNLESISQDMER